MSCDQHDIVCMMVWGQLGHQDGAGHHDCCQCHPDNWTTTFITAAYDLVGIMIKSGRLNVQSVKAVVTPTTASMAHGRAAGSFDWDLTMMNNSMHNDTTPAVDALMWGENAVRPVT